LTEIRILRAAVYPAQQGLGAATAWWRERSDEMPVLFVLAHIANVTPVGTVEVERTIEQISKWFVGK
jgi:hypothetical protein